MQGPFKVKWDVEGEEGGERLGHEAVTGGGDLEEEELCADSGRCGLP